MVCRNIFPVLVNFILIRRYIEEWFILARPYPAIAYENNDIRRVYRSYRVGWILSRARALRALLNRTVRQVHRVVSSAYNTCKTLNAFVKLCIYLEKYECRLRNEWDVSINNTRVRRKMLIAIAIVNFAETRRIYDEGAVKHSIGNSMYL